MLLSHITHIVRIVLHHALVVEIDAHNADYVCNEQHEDECPVDPRKPQALWESGTSELPRVIKANPAPDESDEITKEGKHSEERHDQEIEDVDAIKVNWNLQGGIRFCNPETRPYQ